MCVYVRVCVVCYSLTFQICVYLCVGVCRESWIWAVQQKKFLNWSWYVTTIWTVDRKWEETNKIRAFFQSNLILAGPLGKFPRYISLSVPSLSAHVLSLLSRSSLFLSDPPCVVPFSLSLSLSLSLSAKCPFPLSFFYFFGRWQDGEEVACIGLYNLVSADMTWYYFLVHDSMPIWAGANLMSLILYRVSWFGYESVDFDTESADTSNHGM